MKIKLELFGASRDFSNEDHLEFNIKKKIEIKDLKPFTYAFVKQFILTTIKTHL